MAARLGRQTPTRSFVLEYDRSLSEQAIDIYEKSGNTAMEWQRKLLKDMMAIRSDGLWTHTKCGYTIPRRSGKTELVYMRELWGLENGEQIAHTAHKISTAHSSFEKLKRYLLKSGYVDGRDFTSVRAKGAEMIELFESGGRIQYRTRTGSGGLGEGFDLLIIDEAQEYTDDQRSALQYTVSDSKNPQTIMCGTPPTNVSKGTVFPKFRESALKGDSKNAFWAEWSVAAMTDVHDVEAWYEANPSLGTILTERKIEDEITSDEVDFNIQRLGLWIGYSQSSAITEKQWNALRVDPDELPTFTGRLFCGIKYGKDNKNVSLSIAVRMADKRIFVEAIDCREIRKGVDWILAFLRAADIEKVVIDGANGQRILEDAMKDARIKPDPVLPKVLEIINANAIFTQAVESGGIVHAGQPSLTQSVTNCDKRAIGSNGGFGYESQNESIDISLMDSAILAYWACTTTKPKRKQRISY